MRIKTSGQTHVLYRYGGQFDGKSAELKIGTVPTGTAPADIPTALLDDLTLKEARELREHLEREQTDLARTKLSILTADIDAAIRLVSGETLDDQAAEKLTGSLLRFKTAVNRVQRARQTNMLAVETVVQTPE